MEMLEATWDELLIAEVQKHEFLYNRGNDHHKNKQSRTVAWRTIANNLSAVTKELKTASETEVRWKLLRDRYVRGRRKQQQQNGSGDASGIKWNLHSRMTFLEPFVSHRQNRSQKTISFVNGEIEIMQDVNDSTDSSASVDSTPVATSPTQRSSTEMRQPDKEETGREESCLSQSTHRAFVNRVGQQVLTTDDYFPSFARRSYRSLESSCIDEETEPMMLFFKSLMDKVVKWNVKKQTSFQIDVLKLVQSYCEDK